MDEPRCRLTELPIAWCAHCRKDVRGHQKGRPRLSRPRGTEVRHRFYARYPGTCSSCREHFREGDYIGVTVDSDYVCEDCV